MKCAKHGCRAPAMKEDEYCYFHSQKPETVEKRRRAQQRGGSRGKVQFNDAIESIADVKEILVRTINELRSSGTDNAVAKSRAIGYLCGIMMTAIERGDLEERVAQLEEKMATKFSATSSSRRW